MTDLQHGTGTLEAAVRALGEAQSALDQARRALTAAIVAARRSGTPVAEIAARTGRSPIDIRNTLNAAG